MKKQLSVLLLLAITIMFIRCNDKGPKTDETQDTVHVKIHPMPLPDPGIPGFTFPEDSNMINKWVKAQDEEKMAKHSWGIWTGLTTPSGEKASNGDELLIFETWLTPGDLQKATRLALENKMLKMEEIKEERGELLPPHQLNHGRKQLKMTAEANAKPENVGILVTVRYDPNAADFTIKNRLLVEDTLKSMLNSGKTEIPLFPNNAITLKPTYEIMMKDSMDKTGGYYKLNVWGGPIEDDSTYGYGEGQWKGYVYIDPNNQSTGSDGSTDTGQGRTPGNTYNLNDFIHYRLTKQEAAKLATTFNYKVKEGDPVILVAMHVTSKEILRWTWQTFWWAPNADKPLKPSSDKIASWRPDKLRGAARHYGMAYAYTFIYPDQPYTGGNNIGTSIYAYNPYLEASFSYGPGPDSALTSQAYVITKGKQVLNNCGMRTNCMTCHGRAYYPANLNAPDYQGDTYLSLNDSIYNNHLKVDFAWSIPFNLISGK